MKTITKCISFFLILTVICGCKDGNRENYLKKVLNNLEKIESATYYTTLEAWGPGDSIAVYTNCRFNKEFNNPMDSTIGASFVTLNCDDTTKIESGYDGDVRVLVYHDDKVLVIDDFTVNPQPFRPVSSPFFNYTKNIIQYMLTTQDSITVESEVFDDHSYYKLTIHEDTQVEFFGKAYHQPDNPYLFGETTSIYELWINKSNDLPYKVRREMSHDISAVTCTEITGINELSLDGFQVYDYFPQDYEIRKYRVRNDMRSASDLLGKKAPDWTLNDMNEQPLSLSDIKSKVVLINFTGIGCGPCLAAIPCLRELKETLNDDDFELVAIETWMRKPHLLQNYANKNKLNYTLLGATDEVTKNYQTGRGVPVFFILDEQRMVRNVIIGYSLETTGEEIRNAVMELLR